MKSLHDYRGEYRSACRRRRRERRRHGCTSQATLLELVTRGDALHRALAEYYAIPEKHQTA